MSSTGQWGVPGIGADRTVTESEILWGADQARNGALWKSAVIGSATVDAGNTPTNLLRPGLLLGINSTSNEYEDWDPNASDGTQNLAGILDTEIRTYDLDATARDRVFRVLVGRAPVKAAKLLVEGTALGSSADEWLARRMLNAAGFVLDDDPFGYKAGAVARCALVTGVADTLTAAENGSIISYNNAASVTVTLPALEAGLEYTLLRVGDEEFIVASAEGDNIIFGNDLSGDSVTWTTATEHLGAGVRVRSIYVGTALKWLAEIVQTPFGTAGGSAMTIGLAT